MQNSKNNLPDFETLSLGAEGATVFLDVDGTLVPDGESELAPEVLWKVRELASRNQVLLCTNKRDRERWEKLERALGLPVVTKYHTKPSRGVLKEAGSVKETRVVVGDKCLIDCLFAWRIGARFIKVKRKRSGRESLAVAFSYALDDIVWNLTEQLFS